MQFRETIREMMSTQTMAVDISPLGQKDDFTLYSISHSICQKKTIASILIRRFPSTQSGSNHSSYNG